MLNECEVRLYVICTSLSPMNREVEYVDIYAKPENCYSKSN